MADSQMAIHLQKLGLELKCAFCFKLYTKPVILPCNHLFCSSCVPKSEFFGYECPICKRPFVEQELRHAPYMENMVNNYKCLDASLSSHMLKSGNLARTVGSSPSENSNSRLSTSSPMGTQQALVMNNSTATVKVGKVCRFADSGLRNGNMDKEFQKFESKMSSLAPQTRALQCEQRAVDVDMNRLELGPASPPSLDAWEAVKTDDCNAGCSDDNAKNCLGKKPAKRKVDDSRAGGLNDCVKPKRQKQPNQGLPEIQFFHSPPFSMHRQNSASSASDMNPKLQSSSCDQLAVEPDPASFVNFVCVFCQTWKITEVSGPMQHFSSGKQVFGSAVGCSNVIHAHSRCIEWAPQVYFESDTVIKNLDKEVARATKLKCTSCGLKGAALGCYVHYCRRSYHFPCAYEIVECRWNTDDYLMLCPSHISHKFPSDKSRKPSVKKCTSSIQICDEQRISHESDLWETSTGRTKNWVLCGSDLSDDDKIMLVNFAKKCGATVTKAWNPNVTHLIAATNTSGACSRTLKVLMAILKGRWILKTDWIKACMQSERPVDEEPYEISLDCHGCRDGPKTGRLKSLSNGPQLFNGLRFFFTGDFVPTYRNVIQDLIIAGGGTIIASREELKQVSGAHCSPSSVLVVYSIDAIMGRQDGSKVLQQQVEAERVAVENGSQVVAHTWILDSIASGKLQPFPQI